MMRIRFTSSGLRVLCSLQAGRTRAAEFRAQDTATPAADSNILRDRQFLPTNGRACRAAAGINNKTYLATENTEYTEKIANTLILSGIT